MIRVIRIPIAAFVVLLGALRAAAGESQLNLVPWKVLEPGSEPLKTQFTLFWIPQSPGAMRHSELITSRRLLFYSGRCVAMHVVRADDERRLTNLAAEKAPLAILVEGEKELARVASDAGATVESMVREAIDTREVALTGMLDEAAAKAAAGDHDTAVELYRAVAAQACAFPKLGKVAQRGLRKLGER